MSLFLSFKHFPKLNMKLEIMQHLQKCILILLLTGKYMFPGNVFAHTLFLLMKWLKNYIIVIDMYGTNTYGEAVIYILFYIGGSILVINSTQNKSPHCSVQDSSGLTLAAPDVKSRVLLTGC